MKYLVSILALFMLFPLSGFADDRNGEEQVFLQKKKTHGGHLEFFDPADMPDVYYDSDYQEIIIVTDGFASYYNVYIIRDTPYQVVIFTQISGYGDSIDISSLSSGNYTIDIISEYNNEYEGHFTIE